MYGSVFASMNAMLMRDHLIEMAHLFKCLELLAIHAQEIPYNELFDFVQSSHFCLPLSITKCMDREKLKEETNVEKNYPLK